METKLYKIRNKETGEFSKGGSSDWNIWTKGGKTWTKLAHVKAHMRHFRTYYDKNTDRYPYHNAEIVEITVDYNECFAYDADLLMQEIINKGIEKEKRAEELHKQWVRDRELKQLAELKRKYPNE